MGKNEQRGAHTHNTKNRARSAAAALLLRFSGIQRERMGDPKRPQKAYGTANQERGRHEDLGSCQARYRKLSFPVGSHAGEISYFLSGMSRSTA